MSFARHEEIQSMPNLLEIQKNSYQWFLTEGLRDVFRDVDVVTDYSGNLELRFVDYTMSDKPKYTEEECKAIISGSEPTARTKRRYTKQ